MIISQAMDKKASSKLKMARTISYEEFDRIYSHYELRLGASLSHEALSKSVNTVYIYSLIADARIQWSDPTLPTSKEDFLFERTTDEPWVSYFY
ncbi:hypothetical protein [Paenibacillus sp. B-A-8]|uniref:hypothetical protein n=1 Tax=Paenibacillus sp. B-A-8 TaxID=3400419 RepID=UPI003B02A4F1